MYSHILLPVDISGPNDHSRAFSVASRILDPAGKITLMHAIEPIPTYVETHIPADLQTRSRVEHQDKLDKIASDLGITNTALVLGMAGRSIVSWAEENKVDCIVMASHQPVFSDFFLGSTATWVVRHAQTSIHVLR